MIIVAVRYVAVEGGTVMYEYENSYRTEIKSLVHEAYEWGGVDAYTEIWNRVKAMRESAQKKGDKCTSGFFYALKQIEKMVDSYFNWSASQHYHSNRTDVIRSRMRNADNAIDNLISGATKAGYLVPQQKRVS